MDAYSEYQRWIENVDDKELLKDLLSIKENKSEIEDRFFQPLSFGTAGMRGVLAMGTNRMNRYTVGRATQGLADYLNDIKNEASVAIAYDSRHQSAEFAQETAQILAANGVKAFLFDRLMPVPMGSFSIRDLNCDAGVIITASHNPSVYNGYKVYGSDGCQMTDEAANAVLEKIQALDYFSGIKSVSFNEGLESGKIEYISNDLVERYYENVLAQRQNPKAPFETPISIVYTPLNGAGNEPVREVLRRAGHKNVYVVKEQEMPDGDFPTCPYPNPEMAEAKALGLKLCEEIKPDVFLATDPDSDRVGAAFPERDGTYRSVTGNEVGILMLDYIIKSRLENGSMPNKPVAVRSIVSSALADDICAEAGVEMRVVLTGFKYIGEQILHLEQAGEENRFIFGFEESCGYLSGTYARDKDGVFASLLLAELTSYYKGKGYLVVDVLDKLYEKYGFYRHAVANISFPGAEGSDKMKAVTANLRSNPPKQIAGYNIVVREDIKTHEKIEADGNITRIDLPTSDVLVYHLSNGAKVIVRPSGTEPKMKLYITAKESSEEKSLELCKKIEEDTRKIAGL
ncbi:MAG: phospho-sugar mutase [Oscillospiraceae bacterium]|nr:phospho-sugar mutase [Oscillospiraceae bacterium]